ncbi:hypothetical protein F5J12DRAFT_390315 [Pisolithus orientalis]|uniref:uncharacterized protein n=1 Tax=Pisolithus orientalis TaxID=936130 RepID=UPI0022251200|nr:uncharacterized protein F5J12DRAFT_390315 [Pisolithus orientalis]KAI6028677.1 hypothetical protein F5J12DRAFT_390315 [Pisolithus orientalis]
MLTHREFSAWIVSNNQPLPEYLVAVDEKAGRVSCWIPSEAGKQFSVHWRDHGSNVHTCSFISLDGFVVPGRFLYGTGNASREGVRSGPTSERPFIFAEYHGASSSRECNRNTGTIMLKIKRVSLDGHKRANPFQTIPDAGSRATVSGHCVGYGDERPTYEQCPSTWQIKPYDKASKGSYVTFVFRYRPQDFLLSQGIMSEDDRTAESAVPQRKARPSQRRVTSAPVATTHATGTLITPSPTPSPNTKKMQSVVRFSFA